MAKTNSNPEVHGELLIQLQENSTTVLEVASLEA